MNGEIGMEDFARKYAHLGLWLNLPVRELLIDSPLNLLKQLGDPRDQLRLRRRSRRSQSTLDHGPVHNYE